MAWIMLLAAGVFEIVWASAMKQSDGFSRLGPTLVMLGAMIVSFALLTWAMKTIPLGTAYTIWSGIGALGTFAVGVFAFGELFSPLRIVAALLIVSGLLLMKLSSAH